MSTDRRSVSWSGIAVVSVRSKETTQNATYELLQILGEITAVTLLTTAISPDSRIHDETEVVELSSTGTGRTLLTTAGRFVLNQVRMCRAIAYRNEDAVLFFGATAYVVPILFARLVGKVVILEPRGDVPLTLRLRWQENNPAPVAATAATAVRLLEHAGYLFASAIITYTPSMADELGLDRYEQKLYTSGARHVPTEEFAPDVPFADRERRVGFVGRLDVEKGTDTLAAVIERLPRDVGFVFVGDGPHRETIQRRLAADVREGRVEFTGWVDHEEVPAQLNRIKLLVMPSAPTEGLPSTILEAFACGTPVFATPVSGIRDVVQEGETGFLMDDTDPAGLADRIVEILDRPDLPEIGDRCRAVAESTYSFDGTVERYEQMLAAIDRATR